MSNDPVEYNDSILRYAATVYTALKHDIERSEDEGCYSKKQRSKKSARRQFEVPDIHFENLTEKKLTYDLAFNTLKYQQLLEDILQDVGFFSVHPEFKEDEGLIMTMLFALQQRKFQQTKRQKFQPSLDPLFMEMDDALHCFTVKLNAALARSRIKAHALDIHDMLPEYIREKSVERSALPVYAWVNKRKASMSILLADLQKAGYKLLNPKESECMPTGAFCMDSHCSDVLVFSREERTRLMQHSFVKDGKLVLQDKSSSLGPHSMMAMLNDGDDCVHVNIGCGVTTAHLASLMGQSGNVFGFGVTTTRQHNDISEMLHRLDIKNVKLIPENFLSVEADDPRLRNVRSVLISAECSKSGINNPVDFIVNEGEDPKILHHLSASQNDSFQLSELIQAHCSCLRHAMTFPRVQAVVYTTHSVDKSENENVVSRCMEYLNGIHPNKGSPWRLGPPVLQLTSDDARVNIDRYLRVKSTYRQSGCFTAVLMREAEDLKEAAQYVIARAADILDGVDKTDKKREKRESIKLERGVSRNSVLGRNHKRSILRKTSVGTMKMSPTRTHYQGKHLKMTIAEVSPAITFKPMKKTPPKQDDLQRTSLS